jgi:parallel beta-helix repeat protein
VLKAMGGGYDHGGVTGIIRSEYDGDCDNITLEGLTLDGNRDNSSGHIIGFFNGTVAGEGFNDNGDASDIEGIKSVDNFVALNVDIANTSSYAWDPHELGVNAQFINCVGRNAGLDGMALDRQVNAVITNFIAFDNDRHGLNIVTGSWNVTVTGLQSYNNGSTGLTVQRGSEDIPWPGSVVIEDSEITGNANEGVVIKLSHLVTLSGNTIADNGKTGVLISGANDNIVTDNIIRNNGKATNGYYAEVQIQSYDDTSGVTQWYFSATGNAIYGNTIIHDDGSAKAAIVERLVTAVANAVVDMNAIDGNSITGNFDQGNIIFVGPLTKTRILEADSEGRVQGGGRAEMLIGTADGNTMKGGKGDDVLVGLTGSDRLQGGGGADVFRFTDIDDSLSGSSDLISDFKRGTDKIDLRAMDIGLVSKLEDARGALHFRYDRASGNTIVFDPNSDFEFAIRGKHTDLSSSDFLLANDRAQYIVGTDADDIVFAGRGVDTVAGGTGADLIYSGSGADRIVYETFADSSLDQSDLIMDFTAGSDKIDISTLGLAGLSFAAPAEGRLHVHYDKASKLTIAENAEHDFRITFSGNLTKTLTSGDFYFTEPRLTIVGTSGDDEIVGSVDRNVLDGLGGRDSLTGHDGIDVFRFSAKKHSVEGNQDRIIDFEEGIDKINLRALGYDDVVKTASSDKGELRIAYSAASDRTYFRDDYSVFEFSLEGDFRKIDIDATFLL